jgi:hypothetical protein
MAEINFNANEVEPQSFDVLPAGEYDAIIVASERKATKNGNGSYLKLEFQVVSGQFQNRKIWENLNIDNPSPKAKQIALGTLSAICRAVGVMTPKDSSELHNRPMRIKLAIEKTDDYGEQNRVKAITPQNGSITTNRPAAPASVGSPWPTGARS